MCAHGVLGRVGQAHASAMHRLVLVRLVRQQRLCLLQVALGCSANLRGVRLGANLGGVGAETHVCGGWLPVWKALLSEKSYLSGVQTYYRWTAYVGRMNIIRCRGTKFLTYCCMNSS